MNRPTNDEKGKIKRLIVHYLKSVKETAPKYCDDESVRFGTAGKAFVFHKLSLHSTTNYLKTHVEAKIYSEAAVKKSDERKHKKRISLLEGDAGVYIVRTAILHSDQKSFDAELKKVRKGLQEYHDPTYLKNGRSEFVEGRSGYVLGVLWLQQRLKTAEVVSTDDLSRFAKILVDSGLDYSTDRKLKIPLMYQYHERRNIGALHGISTILFTLLKLPLEPSDLNYVKLSIDVILELQNDEGMFPIEYDEQNIEWSCESDQRQEHIQWSYGAPGVFLLMAKASIRFLGEDKYLHSCRKIGELVWKRRETNSSYGLSEGLAGCGYVLLLLYRLTGEDSYFDQVMTFVNVFEEKNAEKKTFEIPEYPMSLFEGNCGTICFLADTLKPSKAAFPFMDIFDD